MELETHASELVPTQFYPSELGFLGLYGAEGTPWTGDCSFFLSQEFGRVSIVRLLATDGYPQTGKGMCNPHPHHHRILLSSTQSVVNGTANKRKDLIA